MYEKKGLIAACLLGVCLLLSNFGYALADSVIPNNLYPSPSMRFYSTLKQSPQPRYEFKKLEVYKLSKYFSSKEFACHHCGKCKVNIQLIRALEALRIKVNTSIIITSGYRCPLYNKACGGAKHSQHLLGNAVDIKIKGYSPSQVARLAKQCGFTWVKVYSSWTHIDVR